MERIYLDHGATTAVHPDVLAAMLPYFSDQFGNPSSVYEEGRRARGALDRARAQVAAAIGAADPSEILFTGSGTEADNMAISGIARATVALRRRPTDARDASAGLRDAPVGVRNASVALCPAASFALRPTDAHVITTAIEHHALLRCCEALEREGFAVTYLPPDGQGVVRAARVAEAIRPETVLISVMMANNEIGVLQPVGEIGALAREKGIPFHTDAVQAVGAVDVDVQAMGIDMLSLSAHKFYGPKGVGALYVRKGTALPPLVYGGGQERGRRGGTENVPAIVGLGAAIERAVGRMPAEGPRLTALRDRLMDGILESIPGARVNGSRGQRLPNNANLCFEGVSGEALLFQLDFAGIAASSGSACSSGALDPSHVLLALGLPVELAKGSLRLTLGEENTAADVDRVLAVLPAIVGRLRRV